MSDAAQKPPVKRASWLPRNRPFPALPPPPREIVRARRLYKYMVRLAYLRATLHGQRTAQALQQAASREAEWRRLLALPSVRAPLHNETRPVDASQLELSMDTWLTIVPRMVRFNDKFRSLPQVTLPVKGARMIFAPHGEHFLWSGETAAYAYKAWDLSNAKTIVVICDATVTNSIGSLALPDPVLEAYASPLIAPPLSLDEKRIAGLRQTGQFETISRADEEREYTLEMQLLWIHHLLKKLYGLDVAKYPLLLPIYVGKHVPLDITNNPDLKALFVNPEIAIVVSSDLSRWGPGSGNYFYSRRALTFADQVPIPCLYLAQPDNNDQQLYDGILRDAVFAKRWQVDVAALDSPIHRMAAREGVTLRHNPPIYESIAYADHLYLHALTLSPRIAYSTFLAARQMLTTSTAAFSNALCVGMAVLHGLFSDKDARKRDPFVPLRVASTAPAAQPARSRGSRTSSGGGSQGSGDGVRREVEKPALAGANLNALQLETMPLKSKLALVALLREKNWMLRGRPVVLRYDRDRLTDQVGVASTSFWAAYVVLDEG